MSDPQVPKSSPTPDCNCASHGLVEEYRHGGACPYGQRLRAAASTPVPNRISHGGAVYVRQDVADFDEMVERARGALVDQTCGHDESGLTHWPNRSRTAYLTAIEDTRVAMPDILAAAFSTSQSTEEGT